VTGGNATVVIDRQEIIQTIARFRKGALQILISFIVLATVIYLFFSKPMMRHLRDSTLQIDLVAFGIPEAFLAFLKLAIYGGLFFSIPLIFYHLWKALAPLFHRKGLKASRAIVLTSIFLFYLGASFCYFITLPFGVQFLLGYQSAHIKPMISVGKYISFCTFFIFGFGLTFELPLILALLSYLRLVRASFLTRNRRYAVLVIAIVAAVVTPTPDVFNMSLMGAPLYILFEIGIILVKMIERKRVEAERLSAQG
jgi:sec-independent protein translocase protein TatC